MLVLAGLWLRRRALIWIGVAVLWLSSTPLVSRLAVRAAEGWAQRGLAKDAPAADAIVILSDGRIIAPGAAAVSEWRDANRFFGGLELYRAGKAPLMVFTGGTVPGRLDVASEGEVLVGYATAMGVSGDSVVTTGRVVNTAEEAKAVAQLMKRRRADVGAVVQTRVLLVTSAYHMSRARLQFARAGLTVLPFPVDFQSSAGTGVRIEDLLPDAAALKETELVWRELYGRLYYVAFR
jgi:uncharacterized SAM-binding protein YcdF (DUF218 family)